MAEPAPSLPPASSERPSSRAPAGAGVGLALAWLGLAAGIVLIPIGWRGSVIDDAFIAFRYAKHLADGEGLVFNVGERVEGFTSLLWTLLMALGIHLGYDAPRLAQALSVTSNLLLVAVCYLFARRRLGHSPMVALIAPMLLVANLDVGAWAAHGLETSLYCLLVLCGLVLLAPDEQGRLDEGRRTVMGSLVMAAASYTRPDGLLYFGVAALPWLARLARERRITRGTLAFWLPFLVPIAALFLWRHSYYGYWLPNTYYAKATGGAGKLEDGARYLVRFFDESLVMGLALLPLTGIVTVVRRGARPTFLMAILLTAAYAVKVGGDTFLGARFFLPVLAPLYLLVQDGLWTFFNGWRPIRPLTVLFVFVLGLGTVASTGPGVSLQARIAMKMTRNRTFLGRLMHEITRPDQVIALNTIGALSYFAERRTLDLYGLTDTHIAHMKVLGSPDGGTGHQKGDGAYILSRQPDFILLRNVWLADIPIEAHRSRFGTSETQIAASPVFETAYEPMNLRLRPDLVFGFYKRKDISRSELEARFASIQLSSLGSLEDLSVERGTEQALFEQGNRQAAAGDLERARELYLKALTLYPGAGDVHLALGQVDEQLGRLEEASEHYKHATELLTDSGLAWLGLGNIEAKQDHTTAAITAYQKALVVDPGLVAAYANLAAQLLKEGRFEAAVPVLKNGVNRAPDDLEMWVRLATAAGSVRRWSDAREAMAHAVKLKADDPKVLALQKWLTPRLPP